MENNSNKTQAFPFLLLQPPKLQLPRRLLPPHFTLSPSPLRRRFSLQRQPISRTPPTLSSSPSFPTRNRFCVNNKKKKMDITEVTLLHHVGIVLVMLWLLSLFNHCHVVFYFLSLVYLFLVHERYVVKLRKKLQYEEKKQAHQKRILSDSESVRWLNYAVEKIWPVCMEQIASQKILLPIIPWFLEKYKPWTAKKALVQHMYLGRNPPLFTEVRVLRHSPGDDHLVLELGMNFCTADDMSSILAVQLRKRLGFGMWTKLHITGMQIEGKILVGVKFLRRWPFLGRVRVCFAEPPYFQMTVKPVFTRGLNVTEVPGIAGWLDKLLSIAFEQTLVQPNMLVVDVERFATPGQEDWFCVDEKEPVAFARVEVIEATDMKPSDLNGLADPYAKGQLGPYRFRTKTQKRTLFPKWHEEFKIPITTWDSVNLLAIEVRDKDHIYDDNLGDCSVNINDLKDGERHDLWLPLENIKMGRLHLAITVLEKSAEGIDTKSHEGETWDKEEERDAVSGEAANKVPVQSPKVADNLEPINIEGQAKTGVWVHHPGSEVSQTWEPRKGKSRRLDSLVHGAPGDSIISSNLTASGSPADDSSSTDESGEGKKQRNKVRRGLHKLGSMFHRRPKKEDDFSNNGDFKSPYANVRAVNQKEIGVKLIVEDDALSGPNAVKDIKEVLLNAQGNGTESPGKGNVKGMAKSILRQARGIKHTLSRKGSDKTGSVSTTDRDVALETDSSDDESLSSPQVQRIPVPSSPIISPRPTDVVTKTYAPVKEVNARGLDRISEKSDTGVEESAESELTEGNVNKVK